MNIHKKIGLATLLLTLPCLAFAGFGDLAKGALNTASSGGADVKPEDLLNKLNPGSVLFFKAYAKYYEALGDAENAKKCADQAEQWSASGKLDSNAATLDNGARQALREKVKAAGQLNESSSKLVKEGNKLYGEGIALLTVQTTAVALAVKKAGPDAATNPALIAASTMCVKGIVDASDFLKVMKAFNGEKAEQSKTKDKSTS